MAASTSSLPEELSSASSDSDLSATELDSPASTPVVSLLDKLKAPKASDFSRKRKVLTNPPPKGKKRSFGSSGQVKVHPSRRVMEFPGEELTISLGNLFCKACREPLSVKKSTTNSHIKSIKHTDSIAKLKTKGAREKDMEFFLKKYDKSVHPKGETLPNEQRLYRIRVLKSFMRAGVPLSKLEHFRDILEENAFRLTERSHMLDLVPLVLEEEKAHLKGEIKGKYLSVIYDGTTKIERSPSNYCSLC